MDAGADRRHAGRHRHERADRAACRRRSSPNNGATISGTVASTARDSVLATFSRSPAHVGFGGAARRGARRTCRIEPHHRRLQERRARRRRPRARRRIARCRRRARPASRMQDTVARRSPTARGSRAREISPAILAARVHVDDTARIDAIMVRFAANPTWRGSSARRSLSIRDGAPRRQVGGVRERVRAGSARSPAPSRTAAATPCRTTQLLSSRLWSANMLDLPERVGDHDGQPERHRGRRRHGRPLRPPEHRGRISRPTATTSSRRFAFDDTVNRSATAAYTFTTTEATATVPMPTRPIPTTSSSIDFGRLLVPQRRGDHGLWTAGIIGAVGNRRIGVAGVNWNVKMRPIRVLGITGYGSFFDIAQGILYAAGLPGGRRRRRDGADARAAPIINMSLGGTSASTPCCANAVHGRVDAGSLIVASAGNDGSDDSRTIPRRIPDVMAVAAVGMDGVLATYSNAGTYISVAAPGGDFRLDDNGGGGVLGPGWNFAHWQAESHLRLRDVGVGAVRLGHRRAAARADARRSRRRSCGRASSSSRRGRRARRAATRTDGASSTPTTALTQQNGPPRQTIAAPRRCDDGRRRANHARPTPTAVSRSPNSPAARYCCRRAKTKRATASIGVPGRRFTWAGGFGTPTVFNVDGNAQRRRSCSACRLESEPNDDVAAREHAERRTAMSSATSRRRTCATCIA